METGTSRVKKGMAEMQKGGVIMDVMNAEQARIAEAAGASALWLWNGCLRIFVQQAALLVWRTRRS